uniref:Nicotinic acetylcholine receptor alpha 16 n=1 Tax=Cancer borealis TaxID=39395 RepID=A0A1L4BJX2_CANBE|nr:nicotinic acetylcholine receptor alpha 16 [Cancer borealis]
MAPTVAPSLLVLLLLLLLLAAFPSLSAAGSSNATTFTSSTVTTSTTSTTSGSSSSSSVGGGSTIPKNLKLEMNDEKRLLDSLMTGYDRNVRPVRNASNPIIIQLGITLTQIFDMDEKNQVLTTNVWLDQEWVDELLRWDKNEYNGLETIRLPCEKIWLPDIVLYNNADDYTRGYMQSKAMVGHQGKVFWPPPTKFRSTCPVDVTYFPFDDQTCILKLGSWIYDGFQVDVTNRTADVDLTNYIPNGEWELLEARIIRNVIYYSCCPEPFPDVTITITIRRKTLYYMYNVVLPCMMMSVLTLLVFCLPPDSGEKIALGVTVLLAFSVFMLAIAEKMPETSESIPLIGIYLTAVMTITSISIIMTVIVLNCHYRGPIQREVPPWMRRVFLRSHSSGCSYEATPLINARAAPPPPPQPPSPPERDGASSAEDSNAGEPRPRRTTARMLTSHTRTPTLTPGSSPPPSMETFQIMSQKTTTYPRTTRSA